MGAAPPPDPPAGGAQTGGGRQGGSPRTARPRLPLPFTSLAGFGAAPPADADVEPPEELIDPISQELMLDPVLLVETGQSYDRHTIEEWFARCREAERPCTDPLTRKVLRHTTVVPNFSLKSLVTGWAERHRIADLSTFSKGVGRQRTLARPGAAADALAEMRLGGEAAQGGGSPQQHDRLYPALPEGPGGSPASDDSPQPARAPSPLTAVPRQPDLYPTMQPGTSPPGSRREQADVALAALRDVAAPGGGGGGNRGAAPYHSWTLLQLAGDAEGRQLLWENNAVPLAIYLLGQPQQEASELDAAKPALCATLQRLAARDSDVAASIAQCGGIQVLVGELTAAAPERRAASCHSLYFLGWQGAGIRASIVEALAQHAVACRLPPKPLMAFWRLWEQRQEDGSASPGGLAAGREAEWEALALLLHMLAEGTAASSDASAAAAAQQLRQQLDVAGTAVPDALAYAAVTATQPACNFGAAKAAALLAQLPQNLPQITEAVLRAGQQVAASASADGGSPASGGAACIGAACESSSGKAAGRAAQLLWELSYSPASGGTLPAAVQLIQQQGGLLLPGLEAALDAQQGRQAGCRWLAAGLLACLTYEPPSQQRSAPGAAAAADGMRRLLGSPPAAGALQRLLGLLQPDVASAHPLAAQAAALAVANIAAFRGAAPAAAPQVPEASPAGMKAKLAGFTNRLLRAHPGSGSGSGDLGPSLQGSAGSGEWVRALEDLPGEPRAALVHHGALPLLLRLVVHCSAAAAAADATSSAAARAPTTPTLAQPTPLVTPTAQQQAAAAAAAAAEAAAEQRSVLAAALQALNNCCVDPAVALKLQRWARSNGETHQHLEAALTAAMNDRQLQPASREHARLLLLTQSGAPGQRHALACALLAPPARAPAYPNP